MSIACNHCSALHWLDERTTVNPSTIRNPLFSACCSAGDVVLPLMHVSGARDCLSLAYVS